LKGSSGRLDGFVSQLFRGFVKTSDHLCAVCWIDTDELAAGFNALAADYERILAAQFALHLRQRRAHRVGVFFVAEISKRFIPKFGCHFSLQKGFSKY